MIMIYRSADNRTALPYQSILSLSSMFESNPSSQNRLIRSSKAALAYGEFGKVSVCNRQKCSRCRVGKNDDLFLRTGSPVASRGFGKHGSAGMYHA